MGGSSTLFSPKCNFLPLFLARQESPSLSSLCVCSCARLMYPLESSSVTQSFSSAPPPLLFTKRTEETLDEKGQELSLSWRKKNLSFQFWEGKQIRWFFKHHKLHRHKQLNLQVTHQLSTWKENKKHKKQLKFKHQANSFPPYSPLARVPFGPGSLFIFYISHYKRGRRTVKQHPNWSLMQVKMNLPRFVCGRETVTFVFTLAQGGVSFEGPLGGKWLNLLSPCSYLGHLLIDCNNLRQSCPLSLQIAKSSNQTSWMLNVSLLARILFCFSLHIFTYNNVRWVDKWKAIKGELHFAIFSCYLFYQLSSFIASDVIWSLETQTKPPTSFSAVN